LTKTPLICSISIWGLGTLFGGAKPTHGDGTEKTEQKSNKLQITLFFSTSFYEWVQLILLL